MLLRTSLFTLFLALGSALAAQETSLKPGISYPKSIKGFEGDLQLVTNGTAAANGKPVLIVR